LGAKSRILDPFVGAGSTAVVAARRGIPITAFDSNPLACLVTEARISGSPESSNLLKALDDVIDPLSSLKSPASKVKAEIEEFFDRQAYEYARKWFREDTLIRTLELLSRISKIRDVQLQRLFFISAAQVIREVANVDPRCTHHLVTKKKAFLDPVPRWRDRVISSAGLIGAPMDNVDQVSIKQGSFFDQRFDQEEHDFLLAHPPYLGVINYHLIHKLATDLFDFITNKLHPKSLKHYDFDYKILKSADVSTDNTDQYRKFICSFVKHTSEIMKPRGRCAVIVGDQRHKGYLRHTFTHFIRAFEESGFALEENFIWALQNNSGMHILRRGNFIDHNYILVFQKLA
jgi:DNA modification methylase